MVIIDEAHKFRNDTAQAYDELQRICKTKKNKKRSTNREYRSGNLKWTIQRNWQHKVHKTKKNKAKTQHNMCWTPLYASKHK
jgi:hypothetical protein